MTSAYDLDGKTALVRWHEKIPGIRGCGLSPVTSKIRVIVAYNRVVGKSSYHQCNVSGK